MADNTTLNTMTGGDVIASDDVGGVKYQRVKLVTGDDGAIEGDVSSNNPIATKSSSDSMLARILGVLTRPIWYNPTTNALRADINSGTIGTVTSVTTVNTVNQVAGYDAKITQLYSTDRNLWANAVRSNVI